MTQTTNLGLKKIDGADNWRQIFDDHNQSMDLVDEAVTKLQEELGIVCDKNKCAIAASAGQYVILKNSSISGLENGLYTASKAIPANTVIDSTYLTAVPNGGLNALNSKIENEAYAPISVSGTRIGFVNKVGRICIALFDVKNGTIPTTGATVPSKYKADSDYSAMCRYYDGKNDQVGTLKIAYNSTTIQLFDLSNNVTTGRYLGGTLVYFTDSTTL